MKYLLKYLTKAVEDVFTGYIGCKEDIAEAADLIKTQVIGRLSKEVDDLVAERDKELDKLGKVDKNWFDSYNFIIDKYCWAIRVRGQQIRLLLTPIMKELPDYGDHMTIQEFRDCCISGGFISSDGHGYYASETEISDIGIPPADCLCRNTRDDFTHVMWFNK